MQNMHLDGHDMLTGEAFFPDHCRQPVLDREECQQQTQQELEGQCLGVV